MTDFQAVPKRGAGERRLLVPRAPVLGLNVFGGNVP